MNLNIPNLISLLRIFFIAPILILLNFEVAHTTYFALIIFLLASLTDFWMDMLPGKQIQKPV